MFCCSFFFNDFCQTNPNIYITDLLGSSNIRQGGIRQEVQLLRWAQAN